MAGSNVLCDRLFRSRAAHDKIVTLDKNNKWAEALTHTHTKAMTWRGRLDGDSLDAVLGRMSPDKAERHADSDLCRRN